MTREIKFRVFCEKHSEWEYYSLGDIICGATTGTNGEGGIFKSETWGQFTGIQDMGAKQIYEGDILKGIKRGSNSDREYIGYVFWQQDQAGWMIRCGKYIMEILSLAMSGWAGENGAPNIFQLDGFEIIGNIHENPELVNPDKK